MWWGGWARIFKLSNDFVASLQTEQRNIANKHKIGLVATPNWHPSMAGHHCEAHALPVTFYLSPRATRQRVWAYIYVFVDLKLAN